MTGLDSSSDQIIEIATVVTDKVLEVIAEGPALAIYQPDSILNQMDDWNQRHHSASGLLDEVRASTIDYAEAQRQTLDFLQAHAVANASPMCGNSICQDRRFLARLMPELEQFFHYRNLDVSTLKELASRWMPEIIKSEKKDGCHRALRDIYNSIDELKYYRAHFFCV